MNLKQVPLDKLNALNEGTLMEALHIEYIEIGPDFVRASMPVTHKTKQPYLATLTINLKPAAFSWHALANCIHKLVHVLRDA